MLAQRGCSYVMLRLRLFKIYSDAQFETGLSAVSPLLRGVNGVVGGTPCIIKGVQCIVC